MSDPGPVWGEKIPVGSFLSQKESCCGIVRLPEGYLTLIHVFYGIMRLVVQMFDEFVLVFSSVFAQCISRLLVHLVFVSGYINHTTYGFGFRSDQMYAIHLIDLRLEQPDL